MATGWGCAVSRWPKARRGGGHGLGNTLPAPLPLQVSALPCESSWLSLCLGPWAMGASWMPLSPGEQVGLSSTLGTPACSRGQAAPCGRNRRAAESRWGCGFGSISWGGGSQGDRCRPLAGLGVCVCSVLFLGPRVFSRGLRVLPITVSAMVGVGFLVLWAAVLVVGLNVGPSWATLRS